MQDAKYLEINGIAYNVGYSSNNYDDSEKSKVEDLVNYKSISQDKIELLENLIGGTSVKFYQGGIDTEGNEDSSDYWVRSIMLSNFELLVNSGYNVAYIAIYNLDGSFRSRESVGVNPLIKEDTNSFYKVVIFKGSQPDTNIIRPSENIVADFKSGIYKTFNTIIEGDVDNEKSARHAAQQVTTSIISKLPDEEDLTIELNGKTLVMKFANRSAEIKDDKVSSLGYIILRPNKSFSELVIDANSIYEIRYEFDLEGEEIEIPENCTLKFVGGKLSNGIIANLANAPVGDTTEILNNIIIKKPQIPIKMDWYVGARNNAEVVLNKIFEGAKDSTGQIVDITVKLDKGIYTFTDVISIDRAQRVYIEGAGIEHTTLLYDGENKENGTFFHLIHFAYGGFDGVKIDGNGKLTNGLILEDDGSSSPRSAYNNFGSIFFRRFYDSNGYCLTLGNINSGLYQVSENIFDVVKTSRCVNGLYLTGQQTINNTINKWQEDTSYSENNTEGTTLTFGGGMINTINNVLSENNYCIHIIEAQNSAQIITLGNIYAENVKGFLRSTAINKGTAARSISINNVSVLLTEAIVMDFNYSTVVDINNLTLRSNSANDYLITSATDFSGYARLQVGLLHKALASGSTLIIDDNIEYHNIFAGEHRRSKKGGTSPLFTLERTSYFNAPNAQLAFKTNGKTDGTMYGMPGYPGVINFDVRNGYTDETVQSYRAHKYGLSTSSMFLTPTDNPTVSEDVQKYTYLYRIYVDSNGLLKYRRYGDNAASVTLSDLNKKDGTTEERPTETYIGFQYFDTTLSKPIWWNGSKWVDSTGTEV